MSKNEINNGGHLEYQQSTLDPIDNKKTSPAADERIRIPTIWIFEVFPPSFIPNLRSAVEKFDWSATEPVLNPDFLDQVDQMRSSVLGGGWINLGYIESEPKRSSMTRTADLPTGIRLIYASIFQFVPSTTIVAFQFFLADSMADLVIKPLRETYKSKKEKLRTGFRIHDVASQKRSAVNRVRDSIIQYCIEWVKNSFPGLYASGQFEISFPVCEMIIFEKEEPYKLRDTEKWNPFLSMIDLHQDNYAWQSPRIPGLYLQLEEERIGAVNKIVLSGNVAKVLPDEKLEMYYGSSREEKIIHSLVYMNYTFSIWVLYVLVRTYEKQLSKLRDDYGTIDFSNYRTAIQKARKLDISLLHLQQNFTGLIHELISLCENEEFFSSNDYDFLPLAEYKKGDPGLISSLPKRLSVLIQTLKVTGEQVNSVANRSAQLASAISNDRVSRDNISLQKRIIFLSWILIALTFILVLSEFENIYEVVKGILYRVVSFISVL